MTFGFDLIKEPLRTLNDNSFTIVLLFLIIFIYNYYTSTFDFFREKGVAFEKPYLFVGNIGRRVLQKVSFHDFVIEIYNKFDGLPYGGFFEGRRPVLVIRDPELIKLVLIRDFDHFTNRNSVVRGSHYLSRMLLNLEGREWKSVRSILTPSFSSSKLRAMTLTIKRCSEEMIKVLKSRNDGDFEIDVKKFFGRYTLDIIGSCAFGIEVNALNDSNSYFASVAEKFRDMSKMKRIFILITLTVAPVLLRVFKIHFLNTKTTDKLVEMLRRTRKLREIEENRRNDFLQLILDAAKKEADENKEGKLSLDDDTINAQVVLFLIAGFETSSTVLSFAAYALAMHPQIQEKLRNEIREKVSKFGGLTYDALAEMSYLDMVVSGMMTHYLHGDFANEAIFAETLRLYPPVARVDRTCTKAYEFPNKQLKLRAGDVLTIPISGLHMDPIYYPGPEEFIPERFSLDEKNKRNPYVHLPFGEGPRNCIGLRFALLSVKMALSNMLLNFEISPNKKTEIHIKYDPQAILLRTQNFLCVDFKEMKDV